MLNSSDIKKRPSTHVKFRGPDDIAHRSAWSTTNCSFNAPSPAARKPTIDNLDEVIHETKKMMEDLEVIANTLKDKRESTHVKFRGPDDIAHRSAWSTTNRSFNPPSPAERKPTLNSFDDAIHDAGMVMEALGLSPAYEPEKRSRVTKILKGRKHKDKKKKKHEINKNDDEQPKSPRSQNKEDSLFSRVARRNRRQAPDEGIRKTRSAFLSDETKDSLSSVFGLAPARRQRTLDEADLREAATITAKAMDRKETTRKHCRR